VGVRWRPPLFVAIVTHLVTQSFVRAQAAGGHQDRLIPAADIGFRPGRLRPELIHGIHVRLMTPDLGHLAITDVDRDIPK
jgi:hypothetical protein